MTWRVLEGSCLDRLRELADGTVQCCITSPPYFGLRDYGVDGQLGLERTPCEYVAALVGAFREVRRVLRDDGTLWLNLGDSYNADGRKGRAHMGIGKNNGYSAWVNKTMEGTKPKDLLMVPAMVALALRADGWYLRSEIIWAKPNPMPESVRDRPTSAHEKVFLLSKRPAYFYDAEAVRERDAGQDHARSVLTDEASLEPSGGLRNGHRGIRTIEGRNGSGRSKRNVWEIATQPYSEAHFATFPPKLVEPMVLAGSRSGDTVLDPFAGAGTVGVVCAWHCRDFVGVELNPNYAEMARRRIAADGQLGRSARRARAVIAGQGSLLEEAE